jgi:nucleotide-binding universal stress UspA family protein
MLNMKKIIAAIDGLKYSQATTDYAIQFANNSYSHLVGVFLDDVTHHSYKIYELIHSEGGVSEQKMEKFEQHDLELRKEAAEKFEISCRNAAINHSVHHDRNIAIRELLHECIYADMLVINSKETLTAYEENQPTRFIRDLLVNLECPVLVVPDQFKPVDKIVFLYDGEPSSVYAIKMFSYMFPNWNQVPMEVVSVKSSNDSMHVPDGRLMKEFMKRHYPEATYTVLKGLADIEIVNYLKNKSQHELIVLGAYRRGMVSRWFSPSMADVLMQEINAPLFIAHNQ